jgi:hypothetical protein
MIITAIKQVTIKIYPESVQKMKAEEEYEGSKNIWKEWVVRIR